MRASIAMLVVLMTCLSQAQGPRHPATFAPEGASPVPLAGQATRVHLLGAVELYDVAVYADTPLREGARLASAQTAKAVRIVITYENSLRRQVTIDWRRELIPPLDGRAMTQLRGAFGALREGDVVVIEYAPERGTTIRINKGVAVSGIDHDLMLAFLDHWVGQRPVSEEMKQALLGGL